jgi:hypothetical protein
MESGEPTVRSSLRGLEILEPECTDPSETSGGAELTLPGRGGDREGPVRFRPWF